MAQRRTRARGKAQDAQMSYERNLDPHWEDHVNVVEFLRGKGAITIRAKEGITLIGHEPGADMTDAPQAIPFHKGTVGRIPVEPPGIKKAYQGRDALALFVVRGRIEIIDDKEFDKAPSNDEVREAARAESRQRQFAMHGGMSVQDQITALRVKLAELEGQKAA